MTTVSYKTRYLPNHPLADAYGVVREHRFVLYEKLGPGTHPCHWCEQPLTWKTFRDTDRADMLVGDHVDENKWNNDPDNLVPSCAYCNKHRNPKPRPKIIPDNELFIVDNRGWRHRAAKRICEVCGVEFLRHVWQIEKHAGGRFCGNACSAMARRKVRQATPTARSDS